MGRSEWLYKAGGGGDGSSGGGGTSETTKPSVKRKTRREKRNNSSSGCMTAIFNLFDIHQNHQFRFHHPSFMSESAINNVALQGVEAPRNSLQSPESMAEVAPPPPPSSSSSKTNFNIPMGGIQIKTKRSDDLSSECSSSPSTKTPNLVARLMGLDLLPEYSSPRPSSSSTTPVNSHHRTRSLPATPRISTASRRSTDNDYHHRLSLQIDKENCNMTSRVQGQEHESLQMKMARRRSELLTVNRQDDDRTSQYAKQIANQVRERISRRLGTDITNTISPATTRLNNEQRRDSNLVLLKPKKQPPLPKPVPAPAPAAKTKRDDSIPFSSSSPKLRLLDINSNLNRPISYSHPKPERTEKLHQTPLMKLGKASVRDQKCKRIASERYDLRLKKIHQQDEVFVNKIISSKKKSTPLLQNHVSNSTKKFLSFKKEMTSSSSSSTTRLPQKQVSLMSMTQLPSNLNSSYNSNATTHTFKHSVQDSTAATSSSATTGRRYSDHFDDYISRIINHCGIHSTTSISTAQWYSHSHPLHPSIFHHLEKLFYSTATATAAAGERRMIFELVDEFLVEIVKPYYMNVKVNPCGMCGSELIGKLCEMMRNIPAAKCDVMEDTDGLISRDMGRSMRRLSSAAIESEAEELVREIEGEIVETMMHEMVISLTD